MGQNSEKRNINGTKKDEGRAKKPEGYNTGVKNDASIKLPWNSSFILVSSSLEEPHIIIDARKINGGY